MPGLLDTRLVALKKFAIERGGRDARAHSKDVRSLMGVGAFALIFCFRCSILFGSQFDASDLL